MDISYTPFSPLISNISGTFISHVYNNPLAAAATIYTVYVFLSITIFYGILTIIRYYVYAVYVQNAAAVKVVDLCLQLKFIFKYSIAFTLFQDGRLAGCCMASPCGVVKDDANTLLMFFY